MSPEEKYIAQLRGLSKSDLELYLWELMETLRLDGSIILDYIAGGDKNGPYVRLTLLRMHNLTQILLDKEGQRRVAA